MAETERPVAVQDLESEEISDYFVCCVCLELLYKPVVLACGHVSCFWCVHKSMSWTHESHCPICRRPYLHFPSICTMLHFLLVKMYPDAYKRRQIETLEEEKKMGTFSPKLDGDVCPGTVEAEVNGFAQSCTTNSGCKSSLNVDCSRDVATQEENASQIKLNDNVRQISRSDVLCVACNQLLFRPIVLNCGHVYCKSCLNTPVNEKLKCQACQSLHPRELPNICLELDHFLEEQFPEEYATKRCAVQPGKDNLQSENSKDIPETNKEEDRVSLWSQRVHCGAGCDCCGMFPIIGERYRCMNCVEEIGFDLCGDCYNSQSKLPGRFNQQHKPDHKFQHMSLTRQPNYMLQLMSGIFSSAQDGQSENGSTASSAQSIPLIEDPEGSELDLTLPYILDEDIEDDLSETETI